MGALILALMGVLSGILLKLCYAIERNRGFMGQRRASGQSRVVSECCGYQAVGMEWQCSGFCSKGSLSI